MVLILSSFTFWDKSVRVNQDSLRSLKALFECMSCVSVEMHLDVSSLLSVFNLRLQAGSRYTPPRPADPSCQAVCIGGGRDWTIFLVSVALDSKKSTIKASHNYSLLSTVSNTRLAYNQVLSSLAV